MVIHGHLFLRQTDDDCYDEAIMLPPAILADTTAEGCFGGIQSRLAHFEPRQDERNVKSLVSDSAPSLVKMVSCIVAQNKHDNSKEMTIHNRCLMHMFWAALCATLSPFSLSSALFCATVLLHKGRNVEMIKKSAYNFVKTHLDTSWDPMPAKSAYNQGLVDLMDQADSHLNQSEDDPSLDADVRAARTTIEHDTL